MNRFLIFMVVFIAAGVVSSASAQIKTRINISKEHQQKIEKVKRLKKEIRKQRKLLALDSVRASGKLSKELKKGEVNESSQAAQTDAHSLQNNLKDSLHFDASALDSLNEFGMKELDEFPEFNNPFDSSLFSSHIEALPTALEERAQSMEMFQDLPLESGVSSNQPLNAFEAAHQEEMSRYLQQANKVPGSITNKDPKYLKMVALSKFKQKALSMITNSSELTQGAMDKMQELKKKYSSVPNSNDLSTGKKINSLQGEPLKKRLTIGGTLQIIQGKPLAIDFSPTVGYKLNKKFTVGLGGTYRGSFGKTDTNIANNVPREVAGYRTYVDYNAYKSFSIHGEFEDLIREVTDQNGDIIDYQWKKGALLGIGKSYNIVKGVKGQMLVLYNFLHDELSPHQRPWVIRFGFELNPIGLLKKR